MTRAEFFRNFELLAGQPGAIPKIRELILQLAVQGKLVQQNSKDESAWKLVERARRAWPERKIQSRKEPERQQAAHTLPSGWVWTCLDELGDTNPRNNADDNLEVSFVPMKLISVEYGKPVSFEAQKWSEIKKGFTHFADGDTVLAKITPCFENGKSAVIRNLKNGVGAGTTELHVFRAYFDCIVPEYALIFLKSPRFISEGVPRMTGSAGQKRVPWDYFANTPFPLPPLAEQRRIVSKIDDLMRLCDELEEKGQAQCRARERLTYSTFHHLTVAKDSTEFRQRFGFILHNSSLVLDDISQLRQTILQLAVQGRLVPQNPKEESGEKLIARLSRRELPDGDHILDEKFRNSWGITAFTNLAHIRSGVTKGRNLAGRKVKSLPYLRVANVQRGFLELNVMKEIAIPTDELEKFRLQPNDLLITEGGDWDKVGRTAIWHAEIEDCIHQNHVFRARLVSSELHPEWFMLYFNSPVGRRYFETAAKQTTNLASINATELRECAVAVPPLAEQKRIVAKVEEMMRLCAKLEEQLGQSGAVGTRLLDSAIHHLLNGEAKRAK